MRYAVVLLLVLCSACERPPPEVTQDDGLTSVLTLVRLDRATLAVAPLTEDGRRAYEHARGWLTERGYRKDSTAYGERVSETADAVVLWQREYFSKP